MKMCLVELLSAKHLLFHATSITHAYCVMLVRVFLRNRYLYKFNLLAQKTCRIQGEFTEVAIVAIQTYQVTYCSPEIAN